MTFRVMIVGAAGVFGSRLAERLTGLGGYDIVLAGRDEAKAAAFLARGIGSRFVVFDRNHPDIDVLKGVAPGVLVDAAGPFQASGTALPEACVAAGIHYIDIADARDFVGGIAKLDGKARAANVAVISGASSTPALSHAVLDDVTKGWRRIDRVSAAIAPGNRTPRGLAVVKAILSYAGRPVRVFDDGAWREAPGWSRNQRINLPGIRPRNAVLCDSPDLDLMVARYCPRISATFEGGLELGLMHHGLWALSWLVRIGFLQSLLPFARPLLWIANRLEPFGTGDGGMMVEAVGQDAAGAGRRARWTLVARDGTGPNVPILPALAIIEALAVNRLAFRGAAAAAGLVQLSELMGYFNLLGMETQASSEPVGAPFLFERAIGPAWAKLPPVTRRIHTIDPAVILEGEADVAGASNAAGCLIAKLFGLPPAANAVPLRVVIENVGEGERWARHYPARVMRSHMSSADPARSTVVEKMGPLRFTLELAASEAGIDMAPAAAHWGRIPLPRVLVPRIKATERADGQGRHRFDVDISVPLAGRLVHYRGWLIPKP
jgi:saccharopine dehydrogenase-like NADP-dependent oxidoreductase